LTNRKEWNHAPDGPIQVSPLWQWPPKPLAAFRWYFDSWFIITINLCIAGLAVASYFWASPTLAQTETFSIGWITLIFARNFILLCVVAGSLHLWFHAYAMQGDDKKYDPRPFPRKGRMFTFNSQVLDNMTWSLASGVTIWSALEALVWWSMANGYAGTLSWGDNRAWFIAIFFLIPVWESLYFYWIHRFLHIPFFYKHIHALHHRNINVGPWSGLSMHPFEHVIFLGSVLIHWIVAAHPIHILFHLQYYTLTAATTHTGFEGLVVKDENRLALGTFHHQMHHRYFECNYGSLEIPWDKFFGSFHDGTAAADVKIKERRKKMMGT